MIRKYIIKYNGRHLEVTGNHAHLAAQRWADKGATVKAEIIAEPGSEPPNLTDLDGDSLSVLEDIARSEGWDKLLHQIRQEEQKELQ